MHTYVCVCVHICVHVYVQAYVCICVCGYTWTRVFCVCVHPYTAVDGKRQRWTVASLTSMLFLFPCFSTIFTIKLLPYGKKLVKCKLPSQNHVRSKCKLQGPWYAFHILVSSVLVRKDWLPGYVLNIISTSM